MQCNRKKNKCRDLEHLLSTDKDTSCLGCVRTGQVVLGACFPGQIFFFTSSVKWHSCQHPTVCEGVAAAGKWYLKLSIIQLYLFASHQSSLKFVFISCFSLPHTASSAKPSYHLVHSTPQYVCGAISFCLFDLGFFLFLHWTNLLCKLYILPRQFDSSHIF